MMSIVRIFAAKKRPSSFFWLTGGQSTIPLTLTGVMMGKPAVRSLASRRSSRNLEGRELTGCPQIAVYCAHVCVVTDDTGRRERQHLTEDPERDHTCYR